MNRLILMESSPGTDDVDEFFNVGIQPPLHGYDDTHELFKWAFEVWYRFANKLAVATINRALRLFCGIIGPVVCPT